MALPQNSWSYSGFAHAPIGIILDEQIARKNRLEIMPDSFSGRVYSKAQCVRERPECAALIGAIAAQWSQVEMELAQAFCFFVFGVREKNNQDGGEYIAIDLMERTTTFQGKTALLLRAAVVRFGEDDMDCKELGKLLKTLDRLHKSRNYVVHGRWGLSDKYPTP